jgi:hypothetical protein
VDLVLGGLSGSADAAVGEGAGHRGVLFRKGVPF